MWSCRYHARRPVEFMILARNPSPQSRDKFSLSQMKIWNFNKSINVRKCQLNSSVHWEALQLGDCDVKSKVSVLY